MAYTMIALVGLSVVAIIATIVASASGASFTSGIWPLVYVFPFPALTVALILILALLAITFRKRTRENRENRR